MDEFEWMRNMHQLRRATQVVPADAEAQIAGFPQEYDIPFEIADDYGKWARWALQWPEAG